MVRFTSLSQRAARDSTIMTRQAEDCAAQDETVKKLIEALKLQELRVVSTSILQQNRPNNGHHPGRSILPIAGHSEALDFFCPGASINGRRSRLIHRVPNLNEIGATILENVGYNSLGIWWTT